MPRINEATDTDLKVIEELTKLGWKTGDTLLYQQKYALRPEHQKTFEGKKSIKPDITLTDMNGNILAVIENKFDDEKKALTKLRTLYAAVLEPRFLYACSPHRILFYDTAWKGLDAGEFRPVKDFMTIEDMLLMIEHEITKKGSSEAFNNIIVPAFKAVSSISFENAKHELQEALHFFIRTKRSYR